MIMRKMFTLLKVLISASLLLNMGEIAGQKVNPANLNHPSNVTKVMRPDNTKTTMKTKLPGSFIDIQALPTDNDTVIDDNGFLQGQFVEVGISNCGCFGTTVEQPAGYHGNEGNYLGFVADPDKDGWDVGDPFYNGDYFLPGSPEEGWGVEFGGDNYGNFSQCGDNTIPGKVTSVDYSDGIHSATWKGDLEGLKIEQVTSFHDTATFFIISVTLTNTTSDTLKNLFYMRNVDPDNEVSAGGDYTTKNKVEFQPNSNTCHIGLVSGTGLNWGMYLGLGTADERARVTYGGFSNRSASDIWTGTDELMQVDSAEDDIAISLSFKIGDLAPGQTTSVVYTYVLDASQINNAIDEVVRLKANGEDITNTLIHSNCDRPIDLIVTNSEGYEWSWSPADHLNKTTGSEVIFSAPLGTYNCSVTGTGVCGDVSFDFTLVIETDADAPVVVAKPELTLPLGDNDTLLITTNTINDGSYDNCHLDTLFLSRYLFTADDTGTTTEVVLTGADDNGLESTDTCLITIMTKADYIQMILDQIIEFADNWDASALTIKMLTDIGITGTVKANLPDYKDNIVGASISTVADVQLIIDQTNAMLDVRNMSQYGIGDASELTIEMLEALDISNVADSNLRFYKIFIEENWIWSSSDVDWAVSNGNILANINQMAISNDASELTYDDLSNMDLDVNSDYLAYYKKGIEAMDSVSKLQDLQDVLYVWDALGQIVYMAQNDDASSLYEDLLYQVGVELVFPEFMSIYQDSIAAADTFATPEEVILLIESINKENAFKMIQEMASNSDASGLTTDLLAAAGVSGNKEQYLEYYMSFIENVDTIIAIEDLQALIDEATAEGALDVIRWMAFYGDGSELSIELLTDAQVSPVYEENLDFYIQSIESADTIADKDALQLLVEIDNAWADVNNMAENDDASELTTDLLDLLGATDVSADYLDFYTAYVEAADGVQNLEELQAIVDAANAFGEIADMFASGNLDGLTIEMLVKAGILRTQSGKLAGYKQAIQDAGSIDNLADLQAIIDAVNSGSNTEIANADMLSIFPNPASKQIFIKGSFNRARLLSVTGNQITEINAGNDLTSLNIEKLANGIYIIEVYNNDNTYRFKFVKE
jgi:hypothetical protein